jgi:hypothetical protein
MKTNTKHILKSVLVVTLFFVAFMISGQPAPGDGGIGGGEGTSAVGGGASLGGGLIVMLSLALGYVTRRIVKMRKYIME